MRKMNTNPTLFASITTGTDEGWWVKGVAPDAIYELRYGPYWHDPEWDYGTVLIDTHIKTALFGTVVEDNYNGDSWPVKIDWSAVDRILKINGLWEDRVETVTYWRIELWRVA